MNIFKYFQNSEIEELVNIWLERFPNLLEVKQIGTSFEERPIWLLLITNFKTGPDLDKPAVWIDANIHATEVTGTTAALAVAYYLLDNYKKDQNIQRLLNNSVYYILPRVNPDGAALALAENPKFLRSGVRPYPYLDKPDGLHPQDIDLDGRILQMRIPDQNGDWKPHPDHPNLMVKREPDEIEGSFYRLFQEGIIEEFDGYLIKPAEPWQGLDFNRNFPFEWKTEADQSGAGPYPGSEKEIRALLDFIGNHPNINLAVTFHTFGRVILRPYSTKSDDEMETQDLWVYKKIGDIGTKLTGYPCVSTYHDFRYHPKEFTTGAFDDWMYDHLGIYTYTIELWDLPTNAGVEKKQFIEWFREHPIEDDQKIFQWLRDNNIKDGYIDWYEFTHPQLGIVELGGWNSMYTWRNPPEKYLGPEIEKLLPFTIALGNLLPKIAFQSTEVSQIGPDTFHIRVVVDNSGFLPTYTSEMGKKRKAVRPLKIELVFPDGVSLIEGKQKTEFGNLEGRQNKLSVTAIGANSPTDNRAKLEWVLEGPQGTEIDLHLISQRAGTIHQKIILH